MTTVSWHAATQPISHAPGLLARLADNVALWMRRARDRAELAQLSERDLRDARISHATLRTELAKPFWRG
jgi:uncharacterized protein YjiS (DUF1127 family)